MGSEPLGGSIRRDERGSVLMLMPAAVLVLLVLSSLALDRALVFGEQRDLVATAQAAANDAVTAGVDPDRLRGDGVVELDAERVQRAIARVVQAEGADVEVEWSIDGRSVVVRLRREVRLLFSPAVPGGDRQQRITAVARADLRRR